MTYRFEDPDKRLDGWLDAEPSAATIARVTNWLFELISDPDSVAATPVPIAVGVPIWAAIIPGTHVGVTYTVLRSPPYPEQMRAVILRSIDAAH